MEGRIDPHQAETADEGDQKEKAEDKRSAQQKPAVDTWTR